MNNFKFQVASGIEDDSYCRASDVIYIIFVSYSWVYFALTIEIKKAIINSLAVRW